MIIYIPEANIIWLVVFGSIVIGAVIYWLTKGRGDDD